MTQASIVGGWGQVKPRRELKLPSGSVVVVQDMDLAELLETGILEHIDIFTQELTKDELEKAQAEGKDIEKVKTEKVMKSDKLKSSISVINDVVSRCVVEPKLHLLEKGETAEQGKIYAHLVPIEDRFVIVGEALPDMSDTFLGSEEPGEAVAAVEDGEGLSDDAIGTAKHHRTDESVSS